MPTYDYRCDANGRTLEVSHRMSESLSTWGELCERAGIRPGRDPRRRTRPPSGHGRQRHFEQQHGQRARPRHAPPAPAAPAACAAWISSFAAWAFPPVTATTSPPTAVPDMHEATDSGAGEDTGACSHRPVARRLPGTQHRRHGLTGPVAVDLQLHAITDIEPLPVGRSGRGRRSPECPRRPRSRRRR